MRLIAVLALVTGFVIYGTAFAADPVNMALVSFDEQPGRITTTITATGADGRPLTGLAPVNFKASLNDVPLNVSDLLSSSQSRQPASVVLLVDVSASMGGEPINQAKIAMNDFIRSLDPADRVALITFSNKVNLVQDFTSDRVLLTQAFGRISVVGQTALYDGVLTGLQKISEAPPGRRMLVLLSDGSATASLGRRDETITTAAAAGVNIFAVGEGNEIDRQYLTDLTTASGGRLLASNAAGLRAAYADIASAIKSQITVVTSVPTSVDRSVPGKFVLQLNVKTDSGIITKDLDPLPGAVPPPFDLKTTGVKANQKLLHKGTYAVTPKAPTGFTLKQIDYSLDGKPLSTTTTAPFKIDIDPLKIPPGNHLLELKATDANGRIGESQLAFKVLPPPHKSFFSGTLLIVALLGGLIALLAYFVIRKKKVQLLGFAGRVADRVPVFARKTDEPFHQRVEGWPPPVAATRAEPVNKDRALGRIVVMDEEAVRGGNLDAIHEFEIKTQPLLLGVGDNCDIVLRDDQGRIAAEEARLWVQRDRLVYHKLTTLSAMATEGVTSGWEFLESGEELRLGAYRILFEQYAEGRQPEPEPEPAPVVPEEPLKPTQEHGMSLSDLWTRTRDETQVPQSGE